MKILELVAENYKRLRVVEITPKGRVMQITGKNGQGKTSVLDAIWAALVGASAIAEKPVRKGADRARIRLNLGEMIVTRTITPNGTHTLTIENAKGVKMATPQTVLDELLGMLTFDPLEFVGMKPKEQIEILRQAAKLDIDIDALNAANEADYEQRTILGREIKRLEGEISGITVSEGLPKERIDPAPIMQAMAEAGEKNKQAQRLTIARQELKHTAEEAQRALDQKQTDVANFQTKVADLKKQLADAELNLQHAVQVIDIYKSAQAEAWKAYENAPDTELIDVSELAQDLQRVQLTNREIDKRTRRETLQEQLREQRRKSDELTRAMEGRLEQKQAALQNAKLPVEGLTFDEAQVLYNGIPIEQLGEGEQIRISAKLAMAANPKLRVLRILHGEALDEDGLAVLAQMAEENDFQIWMAKVDSSGKVGIVMEDGMIKAEAE